MTGLPSSIEFDQLNAVFQPIVSLRNGSILGYEGLIRGTPGSSLYSPGQLFESARDTEHLREIELASIRTVLRAFGELHLLGKLFLNVAPGVLREVDEPLQKIRRYLAEAGVAANQVVIEVTENQPMLGEHSIYEVLSQARAAGFELAIDDLGEGYASLRVWSELQPDFVKIDKHFVHGLHADPVKFQFVRTIRQLSQAVGTRVIGEGVEHENELSVLRDLGVEYAQGFLLSAPAAVPLTQIRADVRSLIRSPRPQQTPQLARLTPGRLSIGQIASPVPPMSRDAPLREAQLRFAADRDLMAIPILTNQMATGLVCRNAALARPPAERATPGPRVHSVMEPDPLILDGRMNLEEVSVLLAQTEWQHFSRPFIVTERSVYKGIATAQEVLRELSRFQSRALRYAHPLTALPGAVPIQEALENMLEQKVSFVAAQCDIDHLKAYNEVFGYPRGDNLIKYAGIVLEAYCDPQLDFLGHVGGGNFTLLMRSGDWRERFATLVDQFNLGRQAFLAQIDIDQAGYHQKDRRGQPVFRDLPSLSIGAVAVAPGQYASHHEVVEAIANASIEAKKAAGGALFVERRTPDHRFRVGFDPED